MADNKTLEGRVNSYAIDREGSIAVGLKLLNDAFYSARMPKCSGNYDWYESFLTCHKILSRLNEQMIDLSSDMGSVSAGIKQYGDDYLSHGDIHDGR